MFDFDGVLLDSFDANIQVFGEFYPQMTEDDIRDLFDGNGIVRLREYQERHGITEIAERQRSFSARYAEVVQGRVMPEYARNLVTDLASRFTLSIVSTSREEGIEGCLSRSGVRHAVSSIFGRQAHDSKVEKIKMAIAHHRGSLERSVYITDTLGDIHEAREAGVHSLAVTWGFHERERLAKGNPWAIVDSPDDISLHIQKYFS